MEILLWVAAVSLSGNKSNTATGLLYCVHSAAKILIIANHLYPRQFLTISVDQWKTWGKKKKEKVQENKH